MCWNWGQQKTWGVGIPTLGSVRNVRSCRNICVFTSGLGHAAAGGKTVIVLLQDTDGNVVATSLTRKQATALANTMHANGILHDRIAEPVTGNAIGKQYA